jgi:hypothetical protein
LEAGDRAEYDRRLLTGARTGFGNFVLPLLIAVIVSIVADLDRPRRGLIGLSQQPLLDLKATLAHSAP